VKRLIIEKIKYSYLYNFVQSIMPRLSRGKLLRISSEDRQQGETNGDFTVNLGNSSFIQNVIGIVLKSVSVKHTFGNVFSGNNSFVFNYNGAALTATVPTGWYSATQYAAELQIQINALPAVLNNITVTLVDMPATTSLNKYFTWQASGGDSIGLFSKDDPTNPNPAADLTGIRLTTPLAVSQTAQSLPDFGGLSELYICSGALASNNAAASSNNGENIPLVCEVPVEVGFGQQIFYRSNDSDLDSIIFPSLRSFTRIDIQLCTRSGVVLDPQQNPVTLVFKLIHSTPFASD
jgi:hypothetical protein